MVHGQSRYRDHEARQNYPPEKATAGKIQLRDRISGSRRRHDDKDRDRRRSDERIDVPNADLRLQEDVNVILEGEMFRPKFDDWKDDLVLRLECRHEPPVERE